MRRLTISILAFCIVFAVVQYLRRQRHRHSWKPNECIIGQSFIPETGPVYLCLQSNTWRPVQ